MTTMAPDLAPGLLQSDEPLVRAFFARAEREPDTLAFAFYPRGARTPSVRLSWGAWAVRVRACAASLLRVGVLPGDRVAILAGNRPLWPVVDLALQSIRAIGVGLYPSSTPAQVDALLADCGARWLFTDDPLHAARLAADPRGGGRDLHSIILDTRGGAMPPLPPIVHDWRQWGDDGGDLLATHLTIGATLDARLAAVSPDDLAAIIYTSGSTGEPKGACITHRYLTASASAIAQVLSLTAGDRGVSFLPYSHAAERIFGQCTRILTGMSAALIEDPAELFPVAAHFEPTLLGGLPRIFERLFEAAEIAARSGEDPRAAVHARIGAQLRLATSGGAPLPPTVGERLAALGVPIVGAYGQTEHLCVAMNRPESPRFDTVGPLMPGTEARLAENGELLLARGPLTFSGYWKRPADTEQAFSEDGVWLRTGDLAEFTADGSLRITGRVKEMIALSTGRKVAPLPIEAALTAHPFIAHAFCHGEGRKFLVALLALRRQVVEQWAEGRNRSPWPALATDPAVRAEVQRAVDAVNDTLARTDRVVAFAVTPDEFTVEAGLLTPTLKLLRSATAQRYAAELAALYADVDADVRRRDAPAGEAR
jgi:long-chain acyl-CoA synthetase